MSNKEVILQKALEIFATEGYMGTGVQKIVDEAGVTKPTMYHYFGSKEGLLRSIYEIHFSKLLSNILELLPYNGDIIKTMEDLVTIYIKLATNEPLFFWLADHLRRSPRKGEAYKIVSTYYKSEHDAINELFVAITQYHTNLIGKEAFLVSAYLSLINGYIEASLSEDMTVQITKEEIHLLAKQFLYGIFSL
ncbi:MAG: TetR/AcrR family transcriptional regulator [Vallitaleaceae bacterium]|jgi:AcrR family transcriptional regulator|nr:TetR/AcrR family transcriptional regulator [Vallitaleaceae bacterium]